MADNKLSLALEQAKAKVDFKEISNEFLVNLVHSALSFDNPSLKKEDVEKVLNSDFVGVAPEKVRNITNQKNAFLKIVEMAKENVEMTEDNLKDLHQILAEGLQVNGGLYRNVNISVKGSNHTPCGHEKVYDRMEKYINYMLEGPKGCTLEYISYCHLQLAKIHPFLDCNGRLARLVLNYQLLKNGYMPVIITVNEREEYFKVLEAFKVEKEIKPFIEFLADLELKSLEQVL